MLTDVDYISQIDPEASLADNLALRLDADFFI